MFNLTTADIDSEAIYIHIFQLLKLFLQFDSRHLIIAYDIKADVSKSTTTENFSHRCGNRHIVTQKGEWK